MSVKCKSNGRWRELCWHNDVKVLARITGLSKWYLWVPLLRQFVFERWFEGIDLRYRAHCGKKFRVNRESSMGMTRVYSTDGNYYYLLLSKLCKGIKCIFSWLKDTILKTKPNWLIINWGYLKIRNNCVMVSLPKKSRVSKTPVPKGVTWPPSNHPYNLLVSKAIACTIATLYIIIGALLITQNSCFEFISILIF